MEKVVLKASAREGLGKEQCKKMRREGKIPAVVYKDGKKGLSVHIDTKELWHVLHTEAGENVIINMDISDAGKHKKKTVIVKEVQHDPLTDRFVHVDFHEISLTEKLKVSVPVVVKGEAAGVKEEDGILTQIMWEIEVECLPTDIPEHIDVHVDELRINDAIHIKDITPPRGVVFLAEPDEVIVSVEPPKEEEVVEEAVEGAEGAEEPEVIKKGKKEEEEEGAEEEAAAEKKEKASSEE